MKKPKIKFEKKKETAEEIDEEEEEEEDKEEDEEIEEDGVEQVNSNNKNKNKKKKDPKPLAFLYYDFEARQDDEMRNGNKTVKVHVINYYAAQLVCEQCANMADDDICELDKRAENAVSPCNVCTQREFKHQGDDSVQHFVDTIITEISPRYRKVIAIAHNAKAYDGQFVLRDIVKRVDKKFEPIITGTNIVVMNFKNVKFIDSLNYIQSSLSAFPKTFGLPDIAKGFFPHFFNKAINQGYKGPLPAKEYFGIRPMNEKALKEFNDWYDELARDNNYEFDFNKELAHYCVLDVIILRRACTVFRNLILESGKVCPFTDNNTIAATCMSIFQQLYMKEKQISILPANGYRLADNQSRVALEWLLWLEYSQNIKIQHAGRGREYVKNKLKLDGYRREGPQEYGYQFHGCYWHGCPRCYPDNRNAPVKGGATYNKRYDNTDRLNTHIRSLGIELIEMWECDFIQEKKNNPQLLRYIQSIPAQAFIALNPRDSFFGGRTGNVVSHYDVKDGEKIHYDDVCSLYPYVLKTKSYPVGHPTLYMWDDIHKICPNNDISNVDGLIKCRILPPQDLFFPVLPVRAHGKLFFPLCRTCLDEMCKDECSHTEVSQRELLGTWVISEVRNAVRKGYKILFISEIWKYEMTQYDPVTKQGGIFAGYIDAFLKIKQEASGWPTECGDAESKARYIEEYERVEGIRLDPEKIKKNPGLRAVAKMCLNCLWGRFGMRENLDKTSIIRSVQDFESIVYNPDHDVSSIIDVDEQTLVVVWKKLKEAVELSKKSNVVIAAFTTAHAREVLYQYLEEKNKDVLYHDTDSVIYVSRGENDVLKRGNFLGDLTDELEGYGEGSYIKSFVSGGAKFYTYIVQKPDGGTVECCKMKGIRLDLENRTHINYDSVRDLVCNNKPAFKVSFDSIRRTKMHQVITTEESKTVRVTGPKRRLDGAAGSLPYGYKRPRI